MDLAVLEGLVDLGVLVALATLADLGEVLESLVAMVGFRVLVVDFVAAVAFAEVDFVAVAFMVGAGRYLR